MADVMIMCPEKNVPVPTQIGLSFEVFKNVTMVGNTLENCPACGQNHVWDGSDAFPDA